jgi:hypothetical protein
LTGVMSEAVDGGALASPDFLLEVDAVAAVPEE